jgi:hypothetical protein
MNKCLVTKLNGVVGNNNLPEIGEFRIKLHAVNEENEFTQVLDMRCSSPVTFKSLNGELLFSNSAEYTSSEFLSEVTFGGSDNITRVYLKNTDATIQVFNKYGITFISNGGSNEDSGFHGLEVNIDDFKYSRGITGLSFPKSNKKVSGNLGTLKQMTELIGLDFSGSSISGDISELQDCKKIKRLNFNGCQNIYGDFSVLGNFPLNGEWNTSVLGTKIKGSVEDFVKVNRRNGRNTGSFTFHWLGDNATFKGVPFDPQKDATNITWTENTITVDEETITA